MTPYILGQFRASLIVVFLLGLYFENTFNCLQATISLVLFCSLNTLPPSPLFESIKQQHLADRSKRDFKKLKSGCLRVEFKAEPRTPLVTLNRHYVILYIPNVPFGNITVFSRMFSPIKSLILVVTDQLVLVSQAL